MVGIRLQLTLKVLLLLAVVLTPLIFSQTTHAVDPLQASCQGAPASPVCTADTDNPLVGPDGVITRATNILSVVVGITAIIVIILAGYKYTMSGGNSNELQQARDTIIYAGVALVVAALAQLIVIFILSSL